MAAIKDPKAQFALRPLTQKEMDAKSARNSIRVKSLSDYIREQLTPKDFYHWLREVAAGRDPDAPKDINGDSATFAQPIDFKFRMKAFQMLLERAYGAVPQHLTLEAELSATVGMNAVASPEALRALPEEKLRNLRETMRALLGAGDAYQVASEVSDTREAELAVIDVDPDK